MTRPCKSVLVLSVILIIILTAMTDRGSLAAGGILDREPFGVSETLVPDFQDAGTKKRILFREDFSADGRKYTEAADPRAEGGVQGSLYDVRWGYFHLFVSRTFYGENKGRDPVRSEGDRNSLRTTVQSFTGILRSDPAGAIDSVGRIFAPQVNLGIEF